MEKLSGPFTFTNKENAVHFNKAPPKTPIHSKSIIFEDDNNQNPKKINVLNDAFKTPVNNQDRVVRRVPLGGKDKNSLHLHPKSQIDENQKSLLSNSASKRRARRLRTPLTNKSKGKLNVYDDYDNDTENIQVDPKSYAYEDEEIEYVPAKEDPIPFIPLNYEPFTREELEALEKSPIRRLDDHTDDLTDDGEVDPYEEFPVYFEFSDDEAKDKEVHKPHFMEPTVASNVKGTKFEVYNDGLSIAELTRLIEE